MSDMTYGIVIVLCALVISGSAAAYTYLSKGKGDDEVPDVRGADNE